MSSLAQLPSVAVTYHKDEEIIIMTANAENLKNMGKTLVEMYGIDPENNRFNIVGCEDVPGFEAVANGTKVDTVLVEPGVVAKAKEALIKYPKTKAFLFECTELPPYSDAVRMETGLPVFDAITCCTAIMSGFLDNKRFGRNKWQKKWDKKQESYKYGQNLTEEEKKELVNKV